MIWGEPSVTDHIARVFDSSRVLLTVLIETQRPVSGIRRHGAAPQQGEAMAALSLGSTQPTGDLSAPWTQSDSRQEAPLEGLRFLLSGNVPLTCRLFRALFEHMLGFAPLSTGQQGNVPLVNQLTGSREHSRSFLSTALFILGAEIDREHLMPFMMQEGLFGMQMFEHMLQNRDYCEAFLAFRRLERAFTGPPAVEEAHSGIGSTSLTCNLEGSPTAQKFSKRMSKTRQRSMLTWPQPICWKR